MKIGDKYKITSDNHNTILEVKRNRTMKHKGEVKDFESWQPYYYPNIKMALMKIVDEESKGVEGIQELLDRWDRLETVIKEVCDD